MKIAVSFNTENAAFEDDLEGEVSRCFDRAKEKAIHQIHNPPSPKLVCDAPEWEDVILDSNGNFVGRVFVMEHA